MLAASEQGDRVVRLNDERLTAFRDAQELATVAAPCGEGHARLCMVGERTLVFDEEAGRLHFFDEALRADGVAEVGRGGRLLAVGERHALFVDGEGRAATLDLRSRKLSLPEVGAGTRVVYACAQSGDLYYVGHGHRLDVWDLVAGRVLSTFRVVLEFAPTEMVVAWEGRYILFSDGARRELFRISDWSRRPTLPEADRVCGSLASRYLALRVMAAGKSEAEWSVVEVSSGRVCMQLGRQKDVWVLPSTTEPTLVIEEADGGLRWVPPVKRKTESAPDGPAERRASRLFAEAAEAAAMASATMLPSPAPTTAPEEAPTMSAPNEAKSASNDAVLQKTVATIDGEPRPVPPPDPAWRRWVAGTPVGQAPEASSIEEVAELSHEETAPSGGLAASELSRWRAQLFGLPAAVPSSAALGSVTRTTEGDADPVVVPEPVARTEHEEAWRDRLVLWSGLADVTPPIGGRLELACARLGLASEGARGLAFLYRRRLLGRGAPAPAQLAVAIGGARGWHEALGQGELARLGVLGRGRLRPRLSAEVVRFLDGDAPSFVALEAAPRGRLVRSVERLVVRFGARAPAEVAASVAPEVASPLAWFPSLPSHPHELAERTLGARLHGRVALFLPGKNYEHAWLDSNPHPLLLVIDGDPGSEQ